MPTNINKIVDGFPHPTIMPITGVPTYEAIAKLIYNSMPMRHQYNPTLVMAY
jgi:hypothetical protein